MLTWESFLQLPGLVELKKPFSPHRDTESYLSQMNVFYALRHKSVKNYFNLSKPSGFFTYHQVKHSKILHGSRFALSVLYGSQNRERLLIYTSLTDWFFVSVVGSVYSAVRNDSLYQVDYISSLKD